MEDSFYTEFTREFLTEFYGTTKYFNVEAIADGAKSKIHERVNKYRDLIQRKSAEWVADHRNLTETNFLEFENYAEEEDAPGSGSAWVDVWYEMENNFVVDLFDVTNVPVEWAYERCKGECPNGDLYDGTELKMNKRYNIKLFLKALAECQSQPESESASA